MPEDTQNTLTDFDLCLALAQVAIDSQMAYAWRAWKRRTAFSDTIRIFKTRRGGQIVDAKVGLEARLAPITVGLDVPNGKLGQVKVTLNITSGTVTYVDEETAELTEYPFRNGTVSFLSDLDKHPVDLDVLARIDPDVQQTAQEVIEKSGLPDAVFSIEYLFLKFTEVDLLLAGNKDVDLPADMPGAARDKALSSLNYLLQGDLGNFMLGTVVRRNNKQGVPTFAMTDFVFDVHGNSDAPDASTLAYLGMLAGRPLPPDVDLARTKLEYAWLRPEQLDGTESNVSGVMAIRKGVFMDDYLIRAFSDLIGLPPAADDRTWTFSHGEQFNDTSSDIIDREWDAARGYTLAISIVPGSNTLTITGQVASHANMDGYTKRVGVLGHDHTEWIHMAGHQDLTGSVTLDVQGMGTAFQVDPVVTYAFGDVVVDNDSIEGGAKVLNAFETAFQALHITGSTTAEKLANQQRELVSNLSAWLDQVLKNITVDLSQHAFIPPGGGVFTFQNLRFSNVGDLIFDVIYQAP